MGVSGISLDTRVLIKQLENPRSALAMEMFCYSIIKQVGAYLAALGGAEAIIFGGGIGEDEPMVRARVCRALRWAGVELDEEKNKRSVFEPGRLSPPNALLAVWTLPAAEGCTTGIRERRPAVSRAIPLITTPIRIFAIASL